MKWIGQHIYDLVARFRNNVIIEDLDGSSITMDVGADTNPLVIYQPVNDANPSFIFGSSANESFRIRPFYLSGSQTLQAVFLQTHTESGAANYGAFRFQVDGTNILDIDDGGIDLDENMGISINGTDILTDSGGDATLSNIDAFDATTIATMEVAMEANLDTLSNVTTVGTIGTGVWQGTAIASAYLDADTAHLTTDQTFSGRKTFSAVTTFSGTQTTFTSATADSPLIKILNTTDDDQAGQLIFEKLRDDDAVANAQNLGEIWFRGQDSAQNLEDYAYIFGEIDVSTSGQESGQLKLGLANHDGGNGTGLLLTGGSEDNEIDVTIGLGANSVVTVPGRLSLGTGLATDQQKHLACFDFRGYGTSDGTNYELPEAMTDNKAPFEHDTSTGSDGLTAQTVQTIIRSGGIVMPYTGVLKKFIGWVASAGTGTVDVGIFKATPIDNNSSNITPVLLVNEQITAAGATKMRSFSETSSFDAGFTAGDIIYSAVLGGTSAKTWYLNSMLEVEWS